MAIKDIVISKNRTFEYYKKHNIFCHILDYDEKDGWILFNTKSKIFLNLKTIYNRFINKKYINDFGDFYNLLADIISHEEMHILIFKDEGMYVSCQYDNIVNKLRKDGYHV